MDKSNKIMGFGMLALVFVIYYAIDGSEDVVSDTLKSILLVGFASIVTWAIIREQQKRGSLKSK